MNTPLPGAHDAIGSRLALGSALSGATYVFDKPPAGLHAADIDRLNGLHLTDTARLVDLFDRLVDTGATDIVVELGPGQAPRVGRWWPRTRASKRGVTFPTLAICSSVTGLCNVSTRASDSVKRAGARMRQENMALWRSWLARRPVTAEVAGSSPVRVARMLRPPECR